MRKTVVLTLTLLLAACPLFGSAISLNYGYADHAVQDDAGAPGFVKDNWNNNVNNDFLIDDTGVLTDAYAVFETDEIWRHALGDSFDGDLNLMNTFANARSDRTDRNFVTITQIPTDIAAGYTVVIYSDGDQAGNHDTELTLTDGAGNVITATILDNGNYGDYAADPRTTLDGYDDATTDGEGNYYVAEGLAGHMLDVEWSYASTGRGHFNGLQIIGRDDLNILTTETDYGTVVTEDGGTDSYTIVLTEAPTSPVTIIADPNNPGDIDLGNGAGNSITLTFDSGNWDTPQTVTVSAVDDSAIEREHMDMIEYTVSSSDANFDGAFLRNIPVTIKDNDAPTLVFVPETVSVYERNLVADSYDITLQTQPSADVTVALSIDDETEATFDPNTIVFTTSNWNDPVTVTVTPLDDDVLEDYEQTVPITHVLTSADALYDGIVVDMPVSVFDDECGAWGYSVADLTGDCYVTLEDFALFATGWLECTSPDEPGCVDLLE